MKMGLRGWSGGHHALVDKHSLEWLSMPLTTHMRYLHTKSGQRHSMAKSQHAQCTWAKFCLPMHVSAVLLVLRICARLTPTAPLPSDLLVCMRQRLHSVFDMGAESPAVQLLPLPVQCGWPTRWAQTSAHASTAAPVTRGDQHQIQQR
jgi:hypothetical protein